ncbi:hypothetical protein ET445_15805 [Agromyces protaetiae]|uniref:Glycosyltransferase RgtA/B/C/D-like domain-containing protein n=1 Tax=Agromyces protaetiae TaxID=2509455 RepID=A0A4P6FEB0_9MICO|nr:hypothetical protein [Agromyces protaetiae]QAY74580.1 hypothetical protein ET445_15805 [Agromyces protaetiae]
MNLTPHSAANTLWSKSTTILLFGVGAVLSIVSFLLVMSMPDMTWHPARDDELRATYQTFQETGTPLIKPFGTGSYYTQAEGPGDLTLAAWDDDPGSYLIASLMGTITHSDSPYPGLKLFTALLVGLPMLWLPLAVARVFRRPIAGYALILLPVVIWLLNGTLLVGTEYGLSDSVSTTPVYALYGIAASTAFLTLSLVLWASTYRLGVTLLVAVSVGIALLAGLGNLARSLSGFGVAAAVGVLWWVASKGRLRLLKALAAAVVAVLVALGVQNGIMALINVQRAEATGISLGELPDGHGTWHPLYLGLAYPEPFTGEPSPFGIVWSDEFGWEQARKVNPDVFIGGEEYDLIMKDLYLQEVYDQPVVAVKLYVKKALFVLQHFGGMVAFILVGFLLVFVRRVRQRRAAVTALAITVPTILLGLVPPVLVMPMLYYFSELSAALGILVAVALGAVAWALTSARAGDAIEVATGGTDDAGEAAPIGSPETASADVSDAVTETVAEDASSLGSDASDAEQAPRVGA